MSQGQTRIFPVEFREVTGSLLLKNEDPDKEHIIENLNFVQKL